MNFRDAMKLAKNKNKLAYIVYRRDTPEKLFEEGIRKYFFEESFMDVFEGRAIFALIKNGDSKLNAQIDNRNDPFSSATRKKDKLARSFLWSLKNEKYPRAIYDFYNGKQTKDEIQAIKNRLKKNIDFSDLGNKGLAADGWVPLSEFSEFLDAKEKDNLYPVKINMNRGPYEGDYTIFFKAEFAKIVKGERYSYVWFHRDKDFEKLKKKLARDDFDLIHHSKYPYQSQGSKFMHQGVWVKRSL